MIRFFALFYPKKAPKKAPKKHAVFEHFFLKVP